jgi:uncharacterized protein YajQ (UPF0234 family)
MASDFSFDISCNFDKQEFQNAVDQAKREIANRFDFKGVLAKIEVIENKELMLQTESDSKVVALIDIIESKMIKRDLPLSILDKSKASEPASGGTVRKNIKLKSSLDSEQVKDISKTIRQAYPKAKPTIQGESVRVVSKSKDELQEIMQLLRQEKNNLPLKFDNFR